MAEAAIEKNENGQVKLTKAVRKQVMWRHQYLQGSWNYERMQNGGWCFSMIPAIKALYKDPEDQKAALKRHLEFYNTHPYVSAPVIGVVLAMEEERANGAPIDDVAIQGVKVGMMGPLAGVGDPVFWFTVRPILGALGASLALSGSIVGPLLFFIAWNIIRIAFLWYTQEAGYKSGHLHHEGPLRRPARQADRRRFHPRHVHHRCPGRALGLHQLHSGRRPDPAAGWCLHRLGEPSGWR